MTGATRPLKPSDALGSKPTLAVTLVFAGYGFIGATGMALYGEGPAPGLLAGILFAAWGAVSLGAIGLARSLLGFDKPVALSFLYWVLASALGIGTFGMAYMVTSAFKWTDIFGLAAVAIGTAVAATIYEVWFRTRKGKAPKIISTER